MEQRLQKEGKKERMAHQYMRGMINVPEVIKERGCIVMPYDV